MAGRVAVVAAVVVVVVAMKLLPTRNLFGFEYGLVALRSCCRCCSHCPRKRAHAHIAGNIAQVERPYGTRPRRLREYFAPSYKLHSPSADTLSPILWSATSCISGYQTSLVSHCQTHLSICIAADSYLSICVYVTRSMIRCDSNAAVVKLTHSIDSLALF